MRTPVCTHLLNIVVNHVRIGRQCLFGQFFKGAVRKPVVRIHVHYVVPGGLEDAGLAGLRKTAVFLVDDNHLPLRELFKHIGQNFHGSVRSAVVHKDELHVLPTLGEQAASAVGNICFNPVNGHYN